VEGGVQRDDPDEFGAGRAAAGESPQAAGGSGQVDGREVARHEEDSGGATGPMGMSSDDD
jgi:hypothetical protein